MGAISIPNLLDGLHLLINLSLVIGGAVLSTGASSTAIQALSQALSFQEAPFCIPQFFVSMKESIIALFVASFHVRLALFSFHFFFVPGAGVALSFSRIGVLPLGERFLLGICSIVGRNEALLSLGGVAFGVGDFWASSTINGSG